MDGKEEWRDVKGYEGLYLVSNKGRVRSVDKVEYSQAWNSRSRKGKLHSLTISGRTGYAQLNLYKDGAAETRTVHRLVAQAFIPNPDGKPEVNHKNGIRTDNRVENLEWVTASENVRHSFHELGREPDHHGRLSDAQVREIRAADGRQKDIGERYGISSSLVGLIKRREIYKEVE